jgi:hypothetical protein
VAVRASAVGDDVIHQGSIPACAAVIFLEVFDFQPLKPWHSLREADADRKLAPSPVPSSIGQKDKEITSNSLDIYN